jgi:hypothetical protein
MYRFMHAVITMRGVERSVLHTLECATSAVVHTDMLVIVHSDDRYDCYSAA